MSVFLRDALRARAQTASGSSTGSRGIESSARGARSASQSRESAKSTTQRSLHSVGLTLASAFSANGKKKKRRRPPVSQLGVPVFYVRDPLAARMLEGVDSLPPDEYGFDGTAHAKCLKDRHGKPWISLVLWSHAGARAAVPLYYENEQIRGELRIHFDRLESLSEVSVWLQGTVYERGAHRPQILSQQACVWPPHGKPQSLFSRKLRLKGTHVWPITFQLPPDVAVFSELAQAASGKVGIQHPATFGPGDAIPFKLMLSSSSPEFVDVITTRYFVRAELARTVIVGDGVLDASYSNHDRSLYPLFQGDLWREGDPSTGRESTSTPSLEEDVDFSSPVIRELPRPKAKQPQAERRPDIRQRRTSAGSSSATSVSENDNVGAGSAKVVRMEGRIQLPTGRMMKPSFRFNGVAIEYLIVVTFTPPDYTHISPRGVFQAECPVWLCSDWRNYQAPRAAGRPGGTVLGETIDVSGRVTREAEVVGLRPARERRTRY
ncbi:hypothetical protein DACRYDRAFT_105015 [Dacryopinax primogenitus]|uniref:Arrestin-like N-terminal domain-containing protein n=1 Tax=Dacryopinax primogenitus (strain DJM 731) TaxID=1858805 RepID=M5G4E2_DACPD|nr:uncharacterized protein DACRYDRAFT_105015 [Dacryopinax primogenitus]EJU05131.1 hypothetical protein DACRYDRAFT_105015 [Dacryopinax primogenitus]